MGFDYASSRATADRLIARFGMSASIVRQSRSGDAWNPSISEAEYRVTLVSLEYGRREVDGSRIQAGDRRLLVAAGGLLILPEIGDRIVVSGAEYRVVAVRPLAPGGTTVMYECTGRV